MAECLLGLGSNLGDRRQHLEHAVKWLSDHRAIDIQAVSPWLETSPVGGPSGQDRFLNGAVLLTTSLSAPQLHTVTETIERQLGRTRRRRWESRTLDVDILLFGDLRLDTPELTIPHPWMAARRFVLQPAQAIAPEMIHPQLKWSIQRMYDHLCSPGLRLVVKRPASGFVRPSYDRLPAESISDPVIGIPRCTQESWAGSGPALDRAIESFELRRQRLVESSWMESDSRVICDFWLKEPPVFIHSDLPAATQWHGHVRKRSFDIPPPKLVILCRPDEASGEEEPVKMLREAIRQADECPWLEPTVNSPEDIEQVVSAVLDSMH